jgi:hypothetical protein
MSNPYIQNALFFESMREQNATINDAISGLANSNMVEEIPLQFNRDPDTLCEQLVGTKWPVCIKV